MLKSLAGQKEVAIMVHGMRNDSAGAASKARIASDRLNSLGYGHMVIAFSYDSDVTGAHLRDNYRAVEVARIIAERNGYHLAAFLEDFAQKSPHTSVRLLGHSLGSEVIVSAVCIIHDTCVWAPIRSVHLFAASSIQNDVISARPALEGVISGDIMNYYYIHDEELGRGVEVGRRPVGLYGMGIGTRKFQDIRVSPENHRFVSYMNVLKSFP